MPALTIPSPPNDRPISPLDTSVPSPVPAAERPVSRLRSRSRSRSKSPDRPPVSPITPTMPVAQLAPPVPTEAPQQKQTTNHAPLNATFIKKPPPVPISDSDNIDAIALRSAISLLQMQREKSKQDIKTLQELKVAAISDPQAFARSLEAQAKRKTKPSSDISDPALAGVSDSEALGDGERNENGEGESTDKASNLDDATSKFPSLPQPQNIIRCPPVEWAKYHIVGEPLDKMHEEQKRWPGSSEPPRTQHGQRAPPHAVASPYSPFTDAVSAPPPPRPHRGSKKSPP